MIDRIISKAIQPVSIPPALAPSARHRLEFLQHKDVFFSGYSTRAQLAQFLKRPDQPMMLAYGYPENAMMRVVNRVLPLQTRHVLLLTPLHTP